MVLTFVNTLSAGKQPLIIHCWLQNSTLQKSKGKKNPRLLKGGDNIIKLLKQFA